MSTPAGLPNRILRGTPNQRYQTHDRHYVADARGLLHRLLHGGAVADQPGVDWDDAASLLAIGLVESAKQ